ncbi:hypothetical protein CW304_11080 [Bacillus sp. UFRGS-B20]|nr:hypothetical protein CW304_11080 [Bacillus sp. UFRGS-B20]
MRQRFHPHKIEVKRDQLYHEAHSTVCSVLPPVDAFNREDIYCSSTAFCVRIHSFCLIDDYK